MEQNYDLQQYLTQSVERIVADSLKAVLRDPRESAFMIRFAQAARRATRLRAQAERQGRHVPAFLIASITSSCNLHCSGCYSRCTQATTDAAPADQLTDAEWLAVFQEAAALGISFIILAGGEPLLRPGVLRAAGTVKNILFPVFTNGTCVRSEDLGLFNRCRNLIPVISLEGGEDQTDARRGEGVHRKVTETMDALRDKGLPFGVSVTVTAGNVGSVTADAFLEELAERGCRLVVYVEYVPVTDESQDLALDDAGRARLEEGIERQRQLRDGIVFLSFPGDEKASGGCLAAGRGFFHINSHGGAEPCPFSPYAQVNVREMSLGDVLDSGFFAALRGSGMLEDEHQGGCVLFGKRTEVENLLASGGSRTAD